MFVAVGNGDLTAGQVFNAIARLKAEQATPQAEDLRDHGVDYTGADVEIAGTIVTANGPEAATDFGRAIADLLGI